MDYKSSSDYLREWVSATQHTADSLAKLQRAQLEEQVAAAALGAFMSPRDAKPEESFYVWINGGIIGIRGDIMLKIVFKGENGNHLVWFRNKEPRMPKDEK